MFDDILRTLREFLFPTSEIRPSVKRSAPTDDFEIIISPKMRRLSRPQSEEWYSSSSSDNSRKLKSKTFATNFPIINLDDDDNDVIEIVDNNEKRKTMQQTSTPAQNGSRKSISGHSKGYFSQNFSAINDRRSDTSSAITNGNGTTEHSSFLRRAREAITNSRPPTTKSSLLDQTFRLDEKRRYKELLKKSTPNLSFSSSDESFSRYYTPVGKFQPGVASVRGRQMVDACKTRQKIVDLIDLTEGCQETKEKPRRSTSTADVVIKVLEDFDDAIVVKDSDSDVEVGDGAFGGGISLMLPTPKPDFNVERVNSLKPLVEACEFSNRKWLEEENEKLRQNTRLKKERSEELQKCTRQLNSINREINQKCLEELVRDSLTIKDCYVIPALEREEEEELRPLTEDQEAVVTKALRSSKGKLIASKFNLNIYSEDITTLSGLSWLNDSVINFYMNLIIERGKNQKFPSVYAFNTFFYPKLIKDGYGSLKRWTRKVDIFAQDLLAVPIHLGMHWCMSIVDFREKTIKYYDSMGGAGRRCLEALYNYLKSEYRDKKGGELSMSGWQLECMSPDEIPQQMNGSDCGVFSCTFAEFITRNAKLSFGQEDMPYFRRKMVYEIVTGQLMIS